MWNTLIAGISPEHARPSPDALYQACFSALRMRLPPSWDLREIGKEYRSAHSRLDALWELRAPDGTAARLCVEIVRQLEPRAVASLLAFLRCDDSGGHPLVVAPFLSPRTRGILAEADAGYADATGNLRLRLDSPAVFIDIAGADSDPWRERRSIHSLKGPAAGRAVRALCDFRPPYGILEIAERSHTPQATMSRVISFLDREALLTRIGRGTVTAVNWQQLIARWTLDYVFTRSNQITTWLEPRGLDALLKKLRAIEWQYAVTGSLATLPVAPYAAARLAALYVVDVSRAAESLGLRPVETGANVLLAKPFDPVVFDRTTMHEGLTYAALSQVAADLLTSPGRGPAEGQELMQWMGEHEDAWRH